MKTRFCVGLLILGLCLSSSVPAVVTSTSSYDLTVAGSVDTPNRSITLEGKTHEVSAIAKATPGDTLRVSVTAPSDADYRVNLYNGDRQVTAQRPATGDATVEFDLTDYEPGSYMLLLSKDGDYKDALPVVITGYDITIDAPTSATTGTEVTADIMLSQTAAGDAPASVEVILANASYTQRVTATELSSTTYRGNLSLQTVSPDDYRVYAIVEGPDTAFTDDQNEFLSVSDATSLLVEFPQTTATTTRTTTPPPAQSSTSQGTTETATTKTTSPTTQTTSTSRTTPPPTSPTQSPQETTAQHPSQSSSVSEQSQTTVPETENSPTGSVITPASPTASEHTTTPTTNPGTITGFGWLAGLVALGSGLYLVRRQNP